MRLPLLVLVATVLVTSGCSGSSGPKAGDFAEGTCRAAAPDVLDVGKATPRLGNGPDVDKSVLADLTKAQDRLRDLAPGAEAPYAKPLQDLVTAVGLVRLQAGVGHYAEATGKNLQEKYDAVVQVCT
jgi:hypothetical protein